MLHKRHGGSSGVMLVMGGIFNMLTRERADRIRALAFDGMEGCDEPQFSILSEIYGHATAILAEMDEPLAVVAAKKGYHISREANRELTKIVGGKIVGTEKDWIINLSPDIYENDPEFFTAPTYAEAEAKARAYLAGLPDVERRVKK